MLSYRNEVKQNTGTILFSLISPTAKCVCLLMWFIIPSVSVPFETNKTFFVWRKNDLIFLHFMVGRKGQHNHFCRPYHPDGIQNTRKILFSLIFPTAKFVCLFMLTCRFITMNSKSCLWNKYIKQVSCIVSLQDIYVLVTYIQGHLPNLNVKDMFEKISFKGILWDRRWIAPSIGIFPQTCWFFYRNAFLILKLSSPPSF